SVSAWFVSASMTHWPRLLMARLLIVVICPMPGTSSPSTRIGVIVMSVPASAADAVAANVARPVRNLRISQSSRNGGAPARARLSPKHSLENGDPVLQAASGSSEAELHLELGHVMLIDVAVLVEVGQAARLARARAGIDLRAGQAVEQRLEVVEVDVAVPVEVAATGGRLGGRQADRLVGLVARAVGHAQHAHPVEGRVGQLDRVAHDRVAGAEGRIDRQRQVFGAAEQLDRADA